MQKLKPALQSSKGRSGPWAGARLVNAFAEISEGDKADLYAVMAIPGFTEWSDIGTLAVRGMHRMGTTLYAVVGITLYSINSAGTESSIGTIPGTGPVRMFDNGLHLGIHDGDTTGYVWDGVTLATPVNLPSVSDGCYIDGYFVWTVADSDQFMISALDNGTSYNVLDIASVEGSPDNLVGVVNDHRELLFFGGGSGATPSTEVWYNSGAADFPLERQGNAFIERGCIDRDSIVKLDNSTFFVDTQRRVCRLAGYDPQRVSTHAVEKTLAEATWFRGFAYSQEGHEFYNLNTDAGSWAHDVATGAWHERKSFGLSYYRVGSAIQAYDKILFGDNQTGKIHQASLSTHSENGAAIPVTIELPPIGDGVQRQTLYAFELFMETGVGDLTVTDPQAILSYSRDGGRSWSNEMWRDLGAQGEYATRAVWRVNVEFRQLQLKIQFPDKVRRCVVSCHADIR